jgi:transposase-like protein
VKRAASRLDGDGSPTLLDVPAVKLARRRGGKVSDYTGADIFRVWPDGYKQAVQLLGEGETVAAIARRLELSRNTVAGIRDRECGSATLEQQRGRSAAEFRSLAALARDKARDVLTDPKAKFRPRDLGALSQAATLSEQQAELLTGGATVRVEHVHTVAPDDFEEMMRRSKRAEVLDTHLSGEDAGQCRRGEGAGVEGAGELARLDAGAVSGDPVQVAPVPSDIVSDDTTHIPNDSARFGSLSPLEPADAAPLDGAQDDDGGEHGHASGGRPAGGEGVGVIVGAPAPNGNLPTEFRDMPSGAQEKK